MGHSQGLPSDWVAGSGWLMLSGEGIMFRANGCPKYPSEFAQQQQERCFQDRMSSLGSLGGSDPPHFTDSNGKLRLRAVRKGA